MRPTHICLIVGAAAVGCGILPTINAEPAATNTSVTTELVLMVDSSGSVDATEFDMQRQGYVAAFRDPDIQTLIEQSSGVAVVYVEWSHHSQQAVRVPWTRLNDAADCEAFADSIDICGARMFWDSTMVTAAMQFAVNEINNNGFDSIRQVVDFSGDGECDAWDYYENGNVDSSGSTDPLFYGTTWADAVAAIPSTMTINGISIGSDAHMLDFYENHLVRGQHAFSLNVTTFADFGDGIKEKLLRELDLVPKSYD